MSGAEGKSLALSLRNVFETVRAAIAGKRSPPTPEAGMDERVAERPGDAGRLRTCFRSPEIFV